MGSAVARTRSSQRTGASRAAIVALAAAAGMTGLITLAGCGTSGASGTGRQNSPGSPAGDAPNSSLSALLAEDDASPSLLRERGIADGAAGARNPAGGPSSTAPATPGGRSDLAEALALQAQRALEMQALLDEPSDSADPLVAGNTRANDPDEPRETASGTEVAAVAVSPKEPAGTDPGGSGLSAFETADATVTELAERLARRLGDEAAGQTDPARALAAVAALEPVLPGILAELREQDPEAFALLLEPQSRVLEQLSTLAEAFASGDPEAAAYAARIAADELAAAAPLTLPIVELCRRVEGFGRYDPLPSRAFLAGRSHPMIVYAEVDRFGREKTTEGYLVRLSLELELRHEADDLLAWRLPPQPVTELSRRPLRDFFLVSRVDLPRSLTVGRYVLKVIVRDQARPGSLAEGRAEIRVVADPRLTQAGADEATR